MQSQSAFEPGSLAFSSGQPAHLKALQCRGPADSFALSGRRVLRSARVDAAGFLFATSRCFDKCRGGTHGSRLSGQLSVARDLISSSRSAGNVFTSTNSCHAVKNPCRLRWLMIRYAMSFDMPGSCVSSPTLAVFRSIGTIHLSNRMIRHRCAGSSVGESQEDSLLWRLHGGDGQVPRVWISMYEYHHMLIFVVLQRIRIAHRVRRAAVLCESFGIVADLA